MKKIFLILTIFCFLFISCPNNIIVSTTQNQDSKGSSENNTDQKDDSKAKTILVVQNQSSISIVNIKYCGEETSALKPGGTWTAKFTDATQGYIYFDIVDSGVSLRTQATVIIEKDKKQTFNITNNTIVIDKEKPVTLSAAAENFSLDGGIFLVYEDPQTHEILYRYFLDGSVYEIMFRDNTYIKVITPIKYQGNVIHFPVGSVQAKVTAAGITFDNVFSPRVTDPAVIQAIKNAPVSQPPQPPAPQPGQPPSVQ